MDTIHKFSFELQSVVPWGRTLDEYRQFFQLTDEDLNKRIVSVGDGPASFNAEMHKLGKKVISFDPIYAFSKDQLKSRISETRLEIMAQVRSNEDNFIWNIIKNPEELEHIRMSAMDTFIEDFEAGKNAQRYIYHEMPERINYSDDTFDLGLSSHFLILYSKLGLEFHIQSINEMLRLCKEIRIFPLVNLNAENSEVLDGIIAYFSKTYSVEMKQVAYEFQKNGNQLLLIKRPI